MQFRSALIWCFGLYTILAAHDGILMNQSSAGEKEQGKLRYAIALHGGAGSDPTAWSAKQREERLNSLKKALTIGKEVLDKGGDSLDAVEQVIRYMEDDPVFNAGRGAVFNSAGGHELDASIMNGRDKSCGAVAGVKTVKNPISLARLVMTKTRHVLLAADGAEQFAREMNVEMVDPKYFYYEPRYQQWRRSQERKTRRNKQDGKQRGKQDDENYKGTVGCVALDVRGNLAAGTSTGGINNKLYGRVGDSPIIGAGTYADNDACGVSCTGTGEHFIRHAAAYAVSSWMKHKSMTPQQAADQVIHRTLNEGDGGLIVVDHRGQIAFSFSTGGMSRAAADSSGRFEAMLGNDN